MTAAINLVNERTMDMTRNFNDKSKPPPAAKDHQKELVKLITGLSPRHSQWQVFSDFAEMGAISISNAVDLAQRDKREERYMEIVKRYKPDELARFPEMLGLLTMALHDEMDDVLGRTFHDLELHNKYSGQYFSPYPLCRMMAKITLADNVEARIAERGFVTAMEPAAGSGAMVIALAHEMKDTGINYQRHLHVTAVDVDPKCVHMAFLQCSLLHIPAIIVHADSLSLEEYGRWHTPAHIIDGWKWKLCRQPGEAHEIERRPDVKEAPSPAESAPICNDGSPVGPSQLTLF